MLDSKKKQDHAIPEVAEFFLLKHQLTVVPRVEALHDEVGAADLLTVNKAQIKNVKNKAKRCLELEKK